MKILAESNKIQSEEALRAGIVDHVADDGVDVLEYANEYLYQLAKEKSPHIIRSLKEWMLSQSLNLLEHQSLASEQEIFGKLWAGPANLEAIHKFSS